MAHETLIGAYSAYAIAVKHGYEGTEAEWVAAQEAARVAAEAAVVDAERLRDEAAQTLATVGEQQRNLIEQKGDETLQSIPEDYTNVAYAVEASYTKDVATAEAVVNETVLAAVEQDSETRLRTRNYLPPDVMYVRMATGYECLPHFYAGNKHMGYWSGTDIVKSGSASWVSEFDIAALKRSHPDYDVILLLRKSDNTTITPAEADSLLCYRIYDPNETSNCRVAWAGNGYICSASGVIGAYVNTTFMRYSKPIYVKGYDSVSLTIPCVTAASSYSGMAFYDKNMRYITGHAYSLGNAERGAKTVEYYVPDNAVYMRTTFWQTQHGFDDQFVCKRHKRGSKLTYSLVPHSSGVINAIKRAKQLTDIGWYVKESGKVAMRFRDDMYEKKYGYYDAGEYTGVPYSYVMVDENWVGDYILPETYLSAMNDVNSVLYTRRATYEASTYYGTVCNGLVRYALNIPVVYGTGEFAQIDGMELVAKRGQYSEYDVRLGDVLVNGDTEGHVAIITDIAVNTSGRIAYIEVAEAVSPTSKRVQYTPADYFEHWVAYDLHRYKYIDAVPYTPDPFAPVEDEVEGRTINDIISVDRGNKSNYAHGDTVNVDFYGSADEYQTIVVTKDGAAYTELTVVDGTTVYPLAELAPGYYTVYATGTKTSDVAEFAVVKSTVTTQVDGSTVELTFSADDGESTAAFIRFGSSGSYSYISSLSVTPMLTETEITNGAASRTIPSSLRSTNDRNIRVYYRNKYGIWGGEKFTF